MVDLEREIELYFERHGIPLLFCELGASLAFKQPDDPVNFLADELKRRSQGIESECMFD